MDICEKIAYIKGLADGLQLDTESKEGKIISAIVELLEDITVEICDIEDACDDMSEQIDAVDEDLAALEDVIYGDDDDCDCCDCCDDDDCDCDCCDDELYEVECPACHDIIYLDAEMLEDEGIDCPNCGTHLEFDFDCDCCDEDCDCCCEDAE